MSSRKSKADGGAVGSRGSDRNHWQDLLHLHRPLATRFTFLIFMECSFHEQGDFFSG
jgi:hypothetical protein